MFQDALVFSFVQIKLLNRIIINQTLSLQTQIIYTHFYFDKNMVNLLKTRFKHFFHIAFVENIKT